MRIAFSGVFLQQPHTGSGQYSRHLLAALREVDPTLEPALLTGPLAPRPGMRGENALKVVWEQVISPLQALRVCADLLHVPYWAPPAASPLPVVATIHDVIPALLPEYRGGRLVRIYTRLVSLTARRAQRILVDSECSRADLIRLVGVRPERIDVAPLAADPSFQPLPAEQARAACRARWGLESPFLLYAGGNDARKNVPALLQAWSLAAGRLPRHELVVAGAMRNDPPFFPDVRGLAARLTLPRLRLLGDFSTADKRLLLAGCDAFIWPSSYEGFGLPPLEALQMGAPVVSSNRSSMPEVVGEAALLVSPDDVNALAAALVQIGQDAALRARLRASGPARAALFTWRRTAELTLASYQRAIAG